MKHPLTPKRIIKGIENRYFTGNFRHGMQVFWYETVAYTLNRLNQRHYRIEDISNFPQIVTTQPSPQPLSQTGFQPWERGKKCRFRVVFPLYQPQSGVWERGIKGVRGKNWHSLSSYYFLVHEDDDNPHWISPVDKHAPNSTVESGIVSVIARWNEWFAARNVHLSVYNPHSLLADVLPVFRWEMLDNA